MVLRPPIRVVLPFITTSPLTDICWTLILLPLWWALGAEQFVPVALVLLAGLKLLFLRPWVRSHPLLMWFALFVAVQLVSALFIVEPFRYVSFLRGLMTYLMALVALFVLVNTLRTRRDVYRLVSSLVTCLSLAALMGLVGELGLMRPRFTSLVGSLLPEAVGATDYGQQIVHRQIGDAAWFRLLGNYFRLDSFFLFSTTYAAALAITLPLAAWLARITTGPRRLMYIGACALLALNLVFTTGRGAMLALAVASAYPLFMDRRLIGRVLTVLATAVLLVVGIATLPSNTLTDTVRAAVYARGEGSAVSRLTIYRHTLNGILERPVFGWGTERDIATNYGFAYPAGSHSDVLGVLYKHGVVGFLLYVVMLIAVWRSGRLPPVDGRVAGSRADLALLIHLRSSVIAAILISFITVLNLDTMLMLVFWVVCGVTIAARPIIAEPEERVYPAAETLPLWPVNP